MPNIRIETRDPVRQMRGLSAHARAVRSVLLEVLTETQYRRVALLYGFDGEPLSERQAALADGCSRSALRESHGAALEKLKQNGYLWASWLLSDLHPPDSDGGENSTESPYLDNGPGHHSKSAYRDADGKWHRSHQRIYGPDTGPVWVVAADSDREDWDTMEPRPGADSYESDRYGRAPSGPEAMGDGWLARKEGVLLKDNPYQRKDLHDAWAAGWREARDDDDSTS